MLSIALLLAEKDPVYEDLASKFWEHFIYIADAMNSQTDAQRSLWDEQDGFFYDYLISAKHERIPVRARTMVGFVPMFGASTVPSDTFERYPDFHRRRQWFIDHRPDLVQRNRKSVVPVPTNTFITALVIETQP